MQRNFAIWPILGSYVWPNSFIGNTYLEEVNYLKNYISARHNFLENNLPGLSICNFESVSENAVSNFGKHILPTVSSGVFELRNCTNCKIEICDAFGKKLLLLNNVLRSLKRRDTLQV